MAIHINKIPVMNFGGQYAFKFILTPRAKLQLAEDISRWTLGA